MALIFETRADADAWIEQNGHGPWTATWNGMEPGRFRKDMALPPDLDRELTLTEMGGDVLGILWNYRTVIALPGDTFTIQLVIDVITP